MEITVHDKTITLNEDQVRALRNIKAFLADCTRLFLSIEGAAGTGKSTLIKEAIRGLSSVAVTAPTHKAKKVVSKFTGRRAVTLHSLLGLRPDMSLEKYDKNNLLFAQLSNSRMSSFGLVIIDESSMVNKDLYDTIRETAAKSATKVVFIGDPFQLTPVYQYNKRMYEMDKKLSPVFTDGSIQHVQLTKVERQKDSNPLMFLYDAIRSNIFSPYDLFEHVSHIRGDEGVQFHNTPPAFAELLVDTFRTHSVATDPGIAKMLCWQNDTVCKWNNYVRMNLFGSYMEPLHCGEVLMAYKSVYDEDETRGLLIQNSAEYLVKEVQAGIRGGIDGWHVRVEDIDSLNPLLSDVFVIRPDIANYSRFVAREQEHISRVKAATKEKRSWCWKQYYMFKNQYLLLEDILDNRDNILVGKDFDYAYALTVHKSQGSTYKYAFVDEHDINFNPHCTERNRLKYVSFSRPTNIAHVLNY